MSDYTEALTRARALRDELVKRSVKTSIEIQQGRPGTPHNAWYDTRFIGSMGHHIVSSRSQGLTPGLALVKRGRTDVPGPLCNGYLGFDNVARIICMGWANHPGAGGPYTLPGGTIPKDAARPYLFGWEIEGGIRESDWPASFRIVMGKCHAATLAWLRRDERSHIEHKTWAPTRKIDRLNYTLTKARAELKPWLTITAPPPPPEDDMELAELMGHTIDTGQGPKKVVTLLANAALLPVTYADTKTALDNQAKLTIGQAQILATLNADPVDEAALAHQLAPLLAPALVAAVVAELDDAVGVTEEQVEAVLRRVLGSLSESPTP